MQFFVTILMILTAGCASRMPSGGTPIRVATSSGESRVETIPLEKYLVGVLEKEVVPSWPVEALKAQAVASRTYALYRKEHPRQGHYDVASDTSDQVFEGRRHHSPAIIKAVSETEGQVLHYDGKVLQSFFHSCCGGLSERADSVWATEDSPPLLSIREDPYCSSCPRSEWEYSLSRDDLETSLSSQGYPLKGDWRLEILKRDPAGRVMEVTLQSGGKTQTIPAARFRELLGFDNLKSTLFEITSDEDPIVFAGRGSGHGVGLCQWGAKGMADEGKTYEEILEFYYPGARIVREGSPVDSEDSSPLPDLESQAADTE